MSGNATPAELGRAQNRGVTGGVNGYDTPTGLGTVRNRCGGGVNGNDTPAGLGTARDRGVAGGVNVNATPAGLGMARNNRCVAGGVSGNATQAGLGVAGDTGVAGGFDATEGVYGRSKLGVHTGFKSDVRVGSKYLASPEERPSSRTWSVGGGLLVPGVSWSMAWGSPWVALLVSGGRGEPVPGGFIGSVGKKARASCVLYL